MSNGTATPSTAAMWSERVKGWRESGETAASYAEGKGFSAASLRYWSSLLKRRALQSAEGSRKTSRIVELVARAARVERAELVIEVGSARIHVGRGFDAELLTQVLAALASGGAR